MLSIGATHYDQVCLKNRTKKRIREEEGAMPCFWQHPRLCNNNFHCSPAKTQVERATRKQSSWCQLPWTHAPMVQLDAKGKGTKACWARKDAYQETIWPTFLVSIFNFKIGKQVAPSMPNLTPFHRDTNIRTVHFIALRYLTLHYITLHYIQT